MVLNIMSVHNSCSCIRGAVHLMSVVEWGLRLEGVGGCIAPSPGISQAILRWSGHGLMDLVSEVKLAFQTNERVCSEAISMFVESLLFTPSALGRNCRRNTLDDAELVLTLLCVR